ncbi:MAG TPA: dihydrolipoamide acetyltransferase family protein [Holophagaceae bacterium]|nr:dihydrolipoamide acetyltransferase family protein [Holophagaceae bacterium]
MVEFRMPKLGADMDRGKVVAWRKGPGDAVAKGEIVAEVETDKADLEVESFTAGTLERILVEPGTWVPIGTPLAIIRAPGEAPGEAPGPAPAPPAEPTQVAAPPSAPATAAAPSLPSASPCSPAARKRAEELGVDLAQVKGTGPGGRITIPDVEAARGQAPEDPQVRLRRAIAAAMSRSKREIPHYYLSQTLDLGPATDWLAAANGARGVDSRLLLGTLLVKAAALALKEVPELNGFWTDGTFQPSAAIHLGIAISLRGGGLLAPAILDTDRLPLDELNARLADLVRRARAGGLRALEMASATATVTSLGDRGVEAVFGVIQPPQVALIGFGTPRTGPWVLGDRVVPRPVVTATLSADHRASDGHRGGLLLEAMERLLASPERL